MFYWKFSSHYLFWCFPQFLSVPPHSALCSVFFSFKKDTKNRNQKQTTPPSETGKNLKTTELKVKTNKQKINKATKCQCRIKWSKSLRKIPSSLFCVGHYSWGLINPVRLHWRELIFLCWRASISDSFLGKAGPCLYFPSRSGIPCGLNLVCAAAAVSVSSYVMNSSAMSGIHPLTLSSCSLSASSFAQIHEPWGEEFDGDLLFRTESHYSLHIVQLWVSLLLTIYCRKYLWCGLSKHSSMTITVCHQKSFHSHVPLAK